MTLFAEQVANAYAIARILGSELTAEEFQSKYSQYHEEALNALSSDNRLAECEVMQRPY